MTNNCGYIADNNLLMHLGDLSCDTNRSIAKVLGKFKKGSLHSVGRLEEYKR